MKSPAIIATALAATAALLFTGCASGTPTASDAAGEDEVTTLRIATIDVDGSIPLMLGESEGIFEKHGLKIESTLSPAFDATLASVMNGQADIGFAATPPLLNALAKKAPVQVVAQTAAVGTREAANVDVVDPAITRPRDLEGRTVAVTSLNDLGAVGVRLSVAKDGGDPSKVDIVELPGPQRLGALLDGRIDAAVLVGPAGVKAQATPGVTVLFQYTDGLPVGSPLDVYFARPDFIEQNSAALERFREAMAEAVEYANANPDAVRAELANLFKDIEGGDQAAQQVELTEYTTDIDPDALTELQDGLMKYGSLAAATKSEDFYSYGSGK